MSHASTINITCMFIFYLFHFICFIYDHTYTVNPQLNNIYIHLNVTCTHCELILKEHVLCIYVRPLTHSMNPQLTIYFFCLYLFKYHMHKL